MLINLTELFTLEGKEKTYTLDIEMKTYHGPNGDYEIADAKPVVLRIMNLGEEDLEEQPYVIGYCLDVDQLVCDELILNLPMKVLCSEDCKGICNRCGTNLNHETCDCDVRSLDPRMAVIQDIFKQFKEV